MSTPAERGPQQQGPSQQEMGKRSEGVLHVDRRGFVSKILDPIQAGIDRPTLQIAPKFPVGPFLVLPRTQFQILPIESSMIDAPDTLPVAKSVNSAIDLWTTAVLGADDLPTSYNLASTFYQIVEKDEPQGIFVVQNLTGAENPLSTIANITLRNTKEGTINLPEGWNPGTVEAVAQQLSTESPQLVSFDVARAFYDMGIQILVHNDVVTDQSGDFITQEERASIGLLLNTMANAEFIESGHQQSGPVDSE